MVMRRRLFSVVITAVLLLSVFPPAPIRAKPALQSGFDPVNAQRATVYIIQMYTNTHGQPVMTCVGSGTLVSADGLILTNAHIVLPGGDCRSDRLVVGLTVRIGEAPVATYYAEVVEVNTGWDLAVLQITSTLDGRPIDKANLSLPFVEMGDSEAVNLDDTINVVGYSLTDEKSSGASQVVRGTVSGFTAEARVGDRAWIKSNAAIPGGMSGGGAYTTDGKLIGVPTIEPARSSGSTLTCRRVQDSNGDGLVDSNDICIPVGGFINALRPSRLARGLVLAAQLAITPATASDSQVVDKPAAPPIFTRLFFSPGVNDAGMPTSVVTGLPAGTKQLYLFFDYSNMVDGMVYELRTTLDGIPSATFSLAPATWSGGRQGMWYIGSTAQAWPNGTYEFNLFIEGVRVASKQITIGGPARQDPVFSDILFGIIDSDNQLVSAGDVLPVGNTLNAVFVYNNIAANQTWKQIWYYEGIKINENPSQWTGGINGKMAINAASTPDKPLQPGRYRLELYIGDEMAATSDFIMAGGEANLQTNIFDNLSFATEIQDGHPGGSTGAVFANTIQHLYAFFDWRDLGTGTPWTWRWSVDGNTLFEVTAPWAGAPTGAGSWLQLATPAHLPDGSYKVDLLIAGVVMKSATAKVGLGQLPVTTFGTAQGVQLQGQIVDAETGQGIPGVSFIVLKSAFDIRDFTWDAAQIYDMSITDSKGDFALSKLLPRNDFYSIIIIAQGYLPIQTDGLEIKPTTKSPMVFNIELNRD